MSYLLLVLSNFIFMSVDDFSPTLFQSYSSLSSSFYACAFHSEKGIIKFYNYGKIFSSSFPLFCGTIFSGECPSCAICFSCFFYLLPLFRGITSTCFVVLNFVYLPISPLKVEFQRNLCCSPCCFWRRSMKRRGKCWRDDAIFNPEIIQHILQPLSWKIWNLRYIKLSQWNTPPNDFYLNPPVSTFWNKL